jgi:hypothetical protein
MDISHAQNHASAMNKLQIDGSIDYKNKEIIHPFTLGVFN